MNNNDNYGMLDHALDTNDPSVFEGQFPNEVDRWSVEIDYLIYKQEKAKRLMEELFGAPLEKRNYSRNEVIKAAAIQGYWLDNKMNKRYFKDIDSNYAKAISKYCSKNEWLIPYEITEKAV